MIELQSVNFYVGLLVSLGVGMLYAGLLYFRSTKWSSSVKPILFISRWLLASLMVFLLFNPIRFSKTKVTHKPILLWMHDVSASMMNESNSPELIQFDQERDDLTERLREKFDVVFLPFSDGLQEEDSIAYHGTLTNISQTIKDARSRWGSEHIGAVLWVTDGIVNEGANPRYSIGEWGVPQYILATGDSSVQPDLMIADIRANKLVYLKNTFEVEIDVISQKLKAGQTNLVISKNGTRIAQKSIKFSSQGVATYVFDILASEVGQLKYNVDLNPIAGEFRTENNHSSFRIDVIDNRKKILIQAKGPHPDLGFLAGLIDQENGTEIIWNYRAWPNELQAFDLIIAHDMPIESLAGFKGNLFWITTQLAIGSKLSTIHSAFDNIEPVMGNDALFGLVNAQFADFNLHEDWQNLLMDSPPLLGPYWPSYWPEWNTVISAKIGRIETTSPIFAVRTYDGRHFAFLAGEGIWKWKMDEVFRTESQIVNTNSWQSAIRYLMVNTARERLSISFPKRIDQGKAFELSALYYDEAYQLIADGNLEISINRMGENTIQPLAFQNGRYRAQIPALDEGIYQYILKGRKGTDVQLKSGSFEVSSQEVELSDLRMRYDDLSIWANETGGEIALLKNRETLVNELLSDSSIMEIYSYQRSNVGLIDNSLIFVLLVLLATLEWFIRKYNGAL